MSKKQPSSKTAHALRSPFSEFSWHLISPQLEHSVLDLLLPIISPIGEHRKKNISKSKGRARSKYRKRTEVFRLQENAIHDDTTQSGSKPEAEPGASRCCTIGFNSTVRCLEQLSQKLHTPEQLKQDDTRPAAAPFAVFVCTTSMPEIMTNPLPLLTATASRSLPNEESIRLISVSTTGAARIAEALHQPRVNVLSISLGVSGMDGLKTLLHSSLEPVKVPWISEAANQDYLPVKIHTEEIVVSQPKAKGEKRKREEQHITV